MSQYTILGCKATYVGIPKGFINKNFELVVLLCFVKGPEVMDVQRTTLSLMTDEQIFAFALNMVQLTAIVTVNFL